MNWQNQSFSLADYLKHIKQTAVWQAIWLAAMILVIVLVLMATPLRYQMLQDDVYGLGDGLQAVGISHTFFALYFTGWELLVVVGSLTVSALIAYKRSDDGLAMLAAVSMALFGLLPPLVDGLSLAQPQWTAVIAGLRMIDMSCVMALFCLFPNGRFVPKWTRPLLWLWLGFLVVVLLINPALLRDTAVLPNTRTLTDALWVLMGSVWYGAGIIGQIIRYRYHATPTEKQQMKWVLFGFSLVVIFSLASASVLVAFPQINDVPQNRVYFTLTVGGAYLLAALALPTTIAFSILRYRLWDVDILINHTLVYSGLTAVILLIYLTLVGGTTLLWQSQNNLPASLIATGLIAILFQPLRERLQREANRLIFGERDNPYGVLSRLGRQLRETAVLGQTLPTITSTITQALKLPYAAIELAKPDGQRQLVAVSGQPSLLTKEWPLLYKNELIGWLLVTPRLPNETFTPKERQLLEDIATQAGGVAYAVRLTSALQRSREQLVLAREEERRRIRRDLHDEFGPSLASQTFKLDAVIDLMHSDPQTAVTLLQTLKKENQRLVGDIRRLVYKLRPPALDELGLIEALHAYTAQIESPPIQLTAVSTPLPPLPAAVEVAAYRIALEAITNVVRHAQAQSCTMTITTTPHHLTLKIVDDGRGLPPTPPQGIGLASMQERAEELGGHWQIETMPHSGVCITAVLPIIAL